LDVHASTVVACARLASGGSVKYEYLTVSTSTRGLLQLADWLAAQGVTHAALEATGVYWKPVWHVLEDQVSLILAHAQHIRNVPGRKSDKNDATWIADLLALGLIRGSFVPPVAIQALRDLTRTRKQLVREIARHTQRVQKDPRGRQYQADRSDQRHPRRHRPRDPSSAYRGRDGSRAAGRLDQKASQGVAQPPGRGAARARDRPSSVHAPASSSPD
jgi:transposase